MREWRCSGGEVADSPLANKLIATGQGKLVCSVSFRNLMSPGRMCRRANEPTTCALTSRHVSETFGKITFFTMFIKNLAMMNEIEKV